MAHNKRFCVINLVLLYNYAESTLNISIIGEPSWASVCAMLDQEVPTI